MAGVFPYCSQPMSSTRPPEACRSARRSPKRANFTSFECRMENLYVVRRNDEIRSRVVWNLCGADILSFFEFGAHPRPQFRLNMAYKCREEIVGKRFLSVSSGFTKIKGKVRDWNWRAGVIRAATHRDNTNPDLQVNL
ncbi:hypothetical protein GWI33_002352 [Rhynchophorus ferrugineus]|uniref:DUF7030 domain-containing protein n=1 Tax=Rhynchophorus ferrugineus TaxID=354439 RepID=A0A834IPG8_RHYFE|nr:hypothetical protein GWI33_002352 [Rhynchophorus ferrugineus]